MKKICILLAAYNGSSYIKDQITSIQSQEYSNWDLFVNIDLSEDSTKEIVDEISNSDSRINILKNERFGSAGKNFYDLIKNAPIEKYDFVAFADQDDIWNVDKLSKAIEILTDKNLTKLFHFARFDIAVLEKNVCPIKGPVYCTKIASKLCRTFGARHGLADLCRDLLGLELDKQNQTSDWGAKELSNSQLKYAASDVLYLHKIKKELDIILERENRKDLAVSCFNFLTTRSKLDLIGFNDLDIFSH